MKKIGGFFCVVASVFLAAYGASAAAQAVEEVEPNYPITSAQPLVFDSTGMAIVNAFMGDGDVDIYSFWAKQGDVVTFDIDNGVKSGAGSIDTIISFHHAAEPPPPATPYQWIIGNDDGDAPDPGSTIGPGDSYLQRTIPYDGVFFVAVTGFSNTVADGGVLRGGPGNATGTYTLIVSGVSPVVSAPAPDPTPDPVSDPTQSPFPPQVLEVLHINIDIKPGRGTMMRADPKSKHDIPVAILSSRTFDPSTVDVSTLTFGRTGDELSLKRCNKRTVRVNHDRKPDLICHFANELAGFEPTDDQATLRGKTADGTPFEGTGALKVIPEKRRGWRERGRHERDDDDDDRRRHRDRRDR